MSLRFKTILGIAAIEALLLVLLVSVTLDYLRSTNYETLTKRASTTATLFATTTKNAVLSYDLASLDAFVKDVLINPDLVYARVVGPENNLFAEAVTDKLYLKPFVADHQVEAVTDGIYDTFANITEDGVIYGRVEIGLDVSRINTVIQEAQNRSIFIAIVEMGLVALFSFLLGGYLTGQLKVLSSAAKSISKGDLNIKLPVKGHDEIADVSNAFNVMASTLKEASDRRDQFETELKELNRYLEDRVEKRTEQLKNKNIELEQANSDIREAQAKLLQAEKMASLGVLAAGVAHEINNPVGFVMSNLRSLDEYGQNYRSLISEYSHLLILDDSEAQQAQKEKILQLTKLYDLDFINEDMEVLIQESIEGTERVKSIVQGLYDYSHTVPQTNYAMNDINECIRATVAEVKTELDESVEINTELTELQPTYCCKSQISLVLLNLIMNAVHATEEKGVVTVVSLQNENWLEVRISDNGKGISPEVLDRIFDPFFTTKAVGDGMGLGLAMVYGILQEHGGDITVESELHKGSCFSVKIPVISISEAAEVS